MNKRPLKMQSHCQQIQPLFYRNNANWNNVKPHHKEWEPTLTIYIQSRCFSYRAPIGQNFVKHTEKGRSIFHTQKTYK
jgi:hypothetical protein